MLHLVLMHGKGHLVAINFAVPAALCWNELSVTTEAQNYGAGYLVSESAIKFVTLHSFIGLLASVLNCNGRCLPF